MMTADEFNALIHDAEVKLARVKALYEQWFQGIEKMEPAVARKDLDRIIELCRKSQPRNTALRFRLQMLVAKYGTYQSYWQRVTRQMEDGTTRRDIIRAQQRKLREQSRQNATPHRELELEDLELEDLDLDDLELEAPEPPKPAPQPSAPEAAPVARRVFSPFGASAIAGANVASRVVPASTSKVPPPAETAGSAARAPFAPPVPPPAGVVPAAKLGAPGAPLPPPKAPPLPERALPERALPERALPERALPERAVVKPAPLPPRPPPPSSLDEQRKRSLYDAYVEARRQNNERIDNVRYETLAKSIDEMVPKLREKHGSRAAIDFEVVVQNGRVGLKPKVK